MTLYMLFAGVGILIYTGLALAEAAVSGFSGAHVAFGLQFALFGSLSIFSRQSSSSTPIASCVSTRPALADRRPGDGESSSSLSCSLRAVLPYSSRQPENPKMR